MASHNDRPEEQAVINADSKYLQDLPQIQTLRSALLSKAWFGFDLDDTLHEFRRASASASTSVFIAIHNESGVAIDTLKKSYRDILRAKTASAFIDGRTSTEYRRERFTTLLQTHDLNASSATIDNLLSIYQQNLREALTLKPGAMQLFKAIKGLGKKVIIVTEGPRDAQEWTVRELGIAPYVDKLVTTNEMGTSKVDGLFSVMLDRFAISAADMVFVGDNEARDVVPARDEGILTVLYDEEGGCRLDLDALRVDSLLVLENALRL
ncbi:HAD-like domain-containing protein [Aspergillus avenaceus]|uniref:HAD-like domain-containing protein n=1 Tax=Aspergillus avenaceus TaxID=36643 RepID=A0A5N6TSR0_ASPAV|nr:HAD-like domain-containing protein [Aspergillus avenaceus]